MTDLLQIPGFRLILLVIIFLLVVWAAYRLLEQARRGVLTRQALQEIDIGANLADGSELLRARKNSAWSRIVGAIEASGLDLADSKPDALREKLASAGYEAPDAPRIYTVIRIFLIFALPLVAIGLLYLTGFEFNILNLYLIGAFFAVWGLFLPALIVRIRADRRTTAITNGFPNCLDLMLVCVEAGLGLEAAFDRVGREMATAEPLVSKLFISTILHLRAGATREDALRKLADDAHVPEVRSFCTLLIQSDKLGTSVGSTLRTYASEMRERRRMRAEERAHRLPIIISIPLVMCMLPVMLGVLMLPALIMVIRTLAPAMTG